MSQYYNLEKTSEILKLTPGEVNRLREQGKLHGFRDGVDWKFRQEDVEKYLTDMIKSRNPDDNMDLLTSGEEDTPTILASSQTSTFASLLDQASDSLDIQSGTEDNSDFLNLIPNEENKSGDSSFFLSEDNALDLGGEDGLSLPSGDSGLDLGGDSGLVLGGGGSAGTNLSDLDLGGESGLVLGGSSPSKLDLGGDSGLVLGGSGSDSDLNLGTGSGISLLDDNSSFDLSSEGDNIVLKAVGPDTGKLDGNGFSISDETTISSSGTLDEDGLFALANDITIAPTGSSLTSDAEEETQLALTDSESDKSQEDQEEDIFKLADEGAAPPPPPQTKVDRLKPTPSEGDDDDIFKLASESDEDMATLLAGNPPQAAFFAGSVAEEDDDGIFSLASEKSTDEDSSLLAFHADTDQESSTVLGEKTEDFQLAPSGDTSDDSDSESASQVIAVDDENNPFVSDDDSTPPGFDGELSPFGNQDDASGLPGMGEGDFGEIDSGGGPFGAGEPSSEEMSGFGTPFGGEPEASGSVASGFSGDLPQAAPNVEGCSWAAGKGCQQEARFSGLDILLILVPSLIILIPTAMAAYELIRFIWSWDEPFTLTGTILEFVGGLFKII